MDMVIAKVKGRGKKQFFKLMSDQSLYQPLALDLSSCVPYNPDHNLDEDAWFRIEGFSQLDFCIDLLKKPFDSKDYDDMTKEQFPNIAYLFSVQDGNFYFQKVTPGLFIKRKTLIFGEVAKLEQGRARLVINELPDAVYFKQANTLVFRNLATISSIFKGIDELYKEATQEEVEKFLAKPFIETSNDYDAAKVSKSNRKRIGLAMTTLSKMSEDDRISMVSYIEDYVKDKLTFDQQKQSFEISTDDQLKNLLYGIEQRFYTTPFSKERRLANSVQPIKSAT
jgi:hypothetical protein